MNILIAQQNYHIGNFEANTAKILEAIARGKGMGADLVVCSELAITGYPPRDFLEFADFIDRTQAALDTIRMAADTIGVLVGCPTRNPEVLGKNLYNSACLLYGQQVVGTVHKTLLPTYDIFDEYRYFEPAAAWQVLTFKGYRLAVTICEDIWNLGDDPMYRICPMDQLMPQSPDIMINLSASPFDYQHGAGRQDIIGRNVARYGMPMVYCNTTGSQTEIVFDGGSLAVNADGSIACGLPYFTEHMSMVSFNGKRLSAADAGTPRIAVEAHTGELVAEAGIPQIHQALVLGIRDYFGKMGFQKAIVASSGGIDSAVTLALACEALGAANVTALLLPSQFSTGHSVDDAVQLSVNLGNPYETIPIKGVYDAYMEALSPVFRDMPFSLAEENLQSRIRGGMVMALANKFNYILLNTSNKSELATGYGTLYGDMAGGLGVLGDLYKVQVYALARYLNRNGEVIPENIITKAPSAELRPGQKDSDSLPDYSVLDPVLYQYIERRMGPREIILMGYDAALVSRVLRLVNNNEYKRNQFCPIIRVSPKAFGVGRRMPIVGKYLG